MPIQIEEISGLVIVEGIMASVARQLVRNEEHWLGCYMHTTAVMLANLFRLSWL
jgi:hypothetical protein